MAARQRDGRAGGEGKYITPRTTTHDYHHHKYDNACIQNISGDLKKMEITLAEASKIAQDQPWYRYMEKDV